MNERVVAGSGRGPDVDDLMELARGLELEDGPALDNAGVQEKLADWYVRSQGLEFTKYRTLTSMSRGQTPARNPRSTSW